MDTLNIISSINWFYTKSVDIPVQLKELESVFNAAYSEAIKLGYNLEAIDRGSLKKRKLELLKHYDHLQKIFLRIVGDDDTNRTLLKAERERLKKALDPRQAQTKFTPYLPHEIAKVLRLDGVTTSATSNSGATGALSLEEARFVENYLATDPCYLKTLTLYQLLQQKTKKICTDLADTKMEITVNKKSYSIYNLQGVSYQFIGCSGSSSAVSDHYQGYLETRWPYICASLISENCPFFWESNGNVFQVFDVPPEAIVHTSSVDLVTPCPRTCPNDGGRTQEAWYALNRRAQVLAAYVNNLHYRLLAMKDQSSQNVTPFLSTPIDQQLRLLNKAQQWVKLLSKSTFSHHADIKEAKYLLLDSVLRQDKNKVEAVLSALKASNFLTNKDKEDYETLIRKLQDLEGKYPHFREANFAADDRTFNRVNLQIKELIDYFKQTSLSPEERKFYYQQLFAKDDPLNQWDILSELDYLEKIINQFPPFISSPENLFPTRLNRLMGPYEVLSETTRLQHNEINLDMRVAGGCKVKAFIITEEFLQATHPEEIGELVAILEFAEKEQIPVLCRSYSAFTS